MERRESPPTPTEMLELIKKRRKPCRIFLNGRKYLLCTR